MARRAGNEATVAVAAATIIEAPPGRYRSHTFHPGVRA